MPIEEITVARATCDGCGRQVTALNPDEQPPGITGNVYEVDRSGGRGGEFFACKRRCVPKAVTAALADADPDDAIGNPSGAERTEPVPYRGRGKNNKPKPPPRPEPGPVVGRPDAPLEVIEDGKPVILNPDGSRAVDAPIPPAPPGIEGVDYPVDDEEPAPQPDSSPARFDVTTAPSNMGVGGFPE